MLLFPLVYLLLFEPLRELVEYIPEKEEVEVFGVLNLAFYRTNYCV